MFHFSTARHSYRLVSAVLLFLACGCSPSEPPSRRITVFVAASLNDVVDELAKSFQTQSGIEVVLNAGASGSLRKQIEMGAPADVFVSADSEQIEALHKAGRTTSVGQILARNRLVIVVPQASAADPDLPKSLAEARYSRIAIATPESAPAGRYAKQALEVAGLWEQISAKLVLADDVRAAARYAELSTVDAAIVYKTDALAVEKLKTAFVFAANSHDPCVYAGAVLAPDDGKGNAFLDFLASEAARPVWSRYGFEPGVSEASIP